MGSELITYSGRLVDPLALKPEDIVIEDVTHGLALTTRFGGGEPRFPSELSPAEWKEGK